MGIKLRVRRSRGRYVTYEITIPKDIIDALNWKEGMELEVRIININSEMGILIRPKKKDL